MTKIYNNNYPIALLYKMRNEIADLADNYRQVLKDVLALGLYHSAKKYLDNIADLEARLEAINNGAY